MGVIKTSLGICRQEIRRHAAGSTKNQGSRFYRRCTIGGRERTLFPTTNDGNKYVLVSIDYFSKWSEAYSNPNQKTTTVTQVLVGNLVLKYHLSYSRTKEEISTLPFFRKSVVSWALRKQDHLYVIHNPIG